MERGLTATFFVLASRVDAEGSLSRGDLRDMTAAGMTIGSHGFDHVPWRRLDSRATSRELVAAREMIAAAAGAPVREVACPFGAYDRSTISALRALDYDHAYTVDGGYARQGSWLQTRRSIHDDDNAATVRRLLDRPRRAWLVSPAAAAKRLVKRWR